MHRRAQLRRARRRVSAHATAAAAPRARHAPGVSSEGWLQHMGGSERLRQGWAWCSVPRPA
eukprot:1023499-Ditylum_brightwellii.AAC.1